MVLFGIISYFTFLGSSLGFVDLVGEVGTATIAPVSSPLSLEFCIFMQYKAGANEEANHKPNKLSSMVPQVNCFISNKAAIDFGKYYKAVIMECQRL